MTLWAWRWLIAMPTVFLPMVRTGSTEGPLTGVSDRRGVERAPHQETALVLLAPSAWCVTVREHDEHS